MTKKKIKNKKNIAFNDHPMQISYLVGDFYQARKLARLSALQTEDGHQDTMARKIFYLTSVDMLALLSGFACLAFTVTVAFLAKY